MARLAEPGDKKGCYLVMLNQTLGWISRNDFVPIEAPRTLGLNSLIMLEIDKTDLQSRSPPVKFFYKKISSTETKKLRSPTRIDIVDMKVLG